MVSHSLNLFWFADVYPTVSHKNCPKKKKNLGPVYWKSPHLGIGNNSWSFQNSNSLKNWWWEIFTYPISTFRCRNCRSSESDYFSILNFIQSSGRTCKTLIKVWKMFLCEFRRLRHDIFSDVSSLLVYHTQCYDFTHATFWLHAI